MLEINTRTNQYADYFLPSTIKLWNNLPLTLRKTESLSIFKKTLKNQNAKDIFFILNELKNLTNVVLGKLCKLVQEQICSHDFFFHFERA